MNDQQMTIRQNERHHHKSVNLVLHYVTFYMMQTNLQRHNVCGADGKEGGEPGPRNTEGNWKGQGVHCSCLHFGRGLVCGQVTQNTQDCAVQTCMVYDAAIASVNVGNIGKPEGDHWTLRNLFRKSEKVQPSNKSRVYGKSCSLCHLKMQT